MDELDDLRLTLHRDPRHVAERTTVLAAQALAEGARAARSRCLAVRGRARRALGQMELAELDLRQAVDDATGPEADHLAADAYLGLAGVLAWAGRTAEAHECLDHATTLGDERTVAYAHLQRASVSQRAGQLDEALAAYQHALPTLRRLDLRTDQALVHMNRGMIRANTDDVAGAFDDLERAETLFAGEGNDFGVAQVRHGTGVTHLRAGDVPAALRALDDAAERFTTLGHDALDVQVDRVEALLAAGLSAEAATAASDLARRFTEAGSHSLAAEAWLRSAQAARFDGDLTTAREYGHTARRLFADQGATGWERAARLEVLRIEAALGHGSVDELACIADELADAGDTIGTATAAALSCHAALADRDHERARALAERCARSSRSVDVLEVRLLVADASAATAAASGDRRTARHLLRRGLDDLARHRAALGAPEARAAVAGHAAGLVTTGLRLAAADGRPSAVFEWTERARAGRVQPRPPAVAGDDGLGSELTALRRVMADVRSRQADLGDTAELVSEQRRLERAVQQRALRAGGAGVQPFRPSSLVDVRARLGERVLVSLIDVDRRLLAVTITHRRARLTDLGDASHAADLAAVAASGLRALADPNLAGARRQARLAPFLASLDALADVVRPALDDGDDPVLLALPASLHGAPWGVVPGLAGRAVGIVPSASWWLDLPSARAATGTTFVAAGPDLAFGDAEALAVGEARPGATVVTGPDATGAAVLRGLGTADVAHIVAHGRVRHDNPSWSALELADGPLSLYELEREPTTSRIVVLSACDSGVGVRAGDQLVGLSSCLLGLGTRSLVASVCRLPDTAVTVELMAALHRGLAADGAAHALARLDRGAPGDDRWIHAACLATFGEV